MLLWHISLCDSPPLPPRPLHLHRPDVTTALASGGYRSSASLEQSDRWRYYDSGHQLSDFNTEAVFDSHRSSKLRLLCVCAACLIPSVSFCWFLRVSVRLSIDRLYFCVVLKLFILTRRSSVSMRPFGKTRLNKKRLTATIVFFSCLRLYLHSVESFE